jgi:hypothetical protein
MHNRVKIAFTSAFLVLSLGLFGMGAAGCRDKDMKPSSFGETVMIQGLEQWFELSEFRKIADKHVQENGADLKHESFEVTCSVHRGSESDLVTFQYFRGFGLPVYHVTFDQFGNVQLVTNRIAKEFVP